MNFPRYRGREIHECKRCPAVIRDGVTDFLAFFAVFSRLRRPAYEKLAALLRQTGRRTVVELCAGSGFSALHMQRFLDRRGLCGEVDVVITDIQKNANWPGITTASKGRVSVRREDARTALNGMDGVFAMFAALHHFSPEELASLVGTAAKRGVPAVFVDYFRRGRLIDLLPLFTGPVLMYLTAPLIYPFSWKRLFWTWVIPVLPLVLFVDTAISLLRSYTIEELKCIVSEHCGIFGSSVDVFEFTGAGGLGRMPAVVVHPGVSAGNGSANNKRKEKQNEQTD